MEYIDWSLLKKSVLQETTAEEEAEVKAWREVSEEQGRYYDKLSSFQQQPEKEEVDVKHHYRIFVHSTNTFKIRRRLRILGYAAACLAGVCLLIIYIHRPQVRLLPQAETIAAGTSRAVLYPANGTPLVLGKDKRKEILATADFRLEQEQGSVRYTVVDTLSVQLEMHTLKIPRGGEFQLCLSDGTRVYVNSESEVKYPVVFTGNTREIILSGEAYFQVTKSEKPFIVRVDGMEVRVWGTEFNVRAYGDERKIQTTLASGQVEVITANGKMMLAPGEQAVLSEGETLRKQKVDVGKYIAWKDGFVAFENERLEDIMSKLAKWYQIEVFYKAPDLKDIRFTGNIDRYGDIRILLDKIGKLDVVRFTVKGHCIVVEPK